MGAPNMICPTCGAPTEEGAQYCSLCGAVLRAPGNPSNAAAPSTQPGVASGAWAMAQGIAEFLGVGSSHTMLEATKEVELSDGKTLSCRLIDVWHDQARTSSGYVKNPSLSISGQRWWLRSVSPSTGRARRVETDGRPDGVDGSNLSFGVVPCFCL